MDYTNRLLAGAHGAIAGMLGALGLENVICSANLTANNVTNYMQKVGYPSEATENFEAINQSISDMASGNFRTGFTSLMCAGVFAALAIYHATRRENKLEDISKTSQEQTSETKPPEE